MRRYLLLIASIAALGVMLILSFTDTAWRMSGRPDEGYPEIAFVAFGLPAALIATVAAGLLARWSRGPGASLTTTATLTATAILALLVCGLQVAFGTGSLGRDEGPALPLIGGVAFWSVPVLFLGLIAGGLLLRRAHRRATRRRGA